MARVSKLSLSAHKEVPEPTEAQGKRHRDWIFQELLSGEMRKPKAYKRSKSYPSLCAARIKSKERSAFREFLPRVRAVIDQEGLQIQQFFNRV
ncbi:hypothetical protein L596_011777 [Steinernema carpocapsae]|uniref:Uncharacterized protein n=1 Tax=Steinernema carpocapsae TaxID=34508 RepID=A0A4U5NVX8_STECR|nr:hypothetical protein L596_011777 [Steinernema carpocapsae]